MIDPTIFSGFKLSKETAGGAKITLNLFAGAKPPFLPITDYKVSILIKFS